MKKHFNTQIGGHKVVGTLNGNVWVLNIDNEVFPNYADYNFKKKRWFIRGDLKKDKEPFVKLLSDYLTNL